MTACSDFFDEPLPGTALEATRWVCVEFSHGWGHDALDGHALGEELASQIKAHMNAHNARFQFIREPGSGGQDSGGHRVLIAESTPGHEALYATTIGSVSDLLSLDVSHPETIPGVTALDSPVALICTHGKRDVCCALKGRPVAALLSQHASGSTDGADAPETTSARVWETSHTGGHRFAPAMIVLPWGFTYGRAGAQAARQIWDLAVDGQVELDMLRGRSAFSKPGQAAEVAVRSRFHLTGVADVVAVENTSESVFRVVCADGNAHSVEVVQTVSDLPARPATCGKGDKEVKVFRATLL
ncbi:sucrase ferredoxin [Brevibacterium paucivorans]|uniref:sucrase ferredoxin n=1 Tax=Brevibacterium paucivorans TaxID=170994 RepID=UPI0032190BB6